MSRSAIKAMVAVIGVLATQAGGAAGQSYQRPISGAQQNWIGGGVTIVEDFSLHDGTTNSQWNFGSALGRALTYEHRMQTGMIVGLEGMSVSPLLRYTAGTSAGAVDCVAGCDANARVRQLMGVMRSGPSNVFHPVYQLAAGVTEFSNFKEQTTGAQIGPAKKDYDFSFGLGYGVGFGLSPSTSVEVIEELGTVLHQRQGLPSGTGNYPRLSALRAGVKFAF